MRFLSVSGLLLLLSACGTGAVAPCGPDLCPSGCCDSAGFCTAGTTASACGTGGLMCSACLQGQQCVNSTCVNTCIRKTCDGLGINCGTADDGCGGRLTCGTCGAGESCGAGGTPNVCGPGTCTPKTCGSSSAQCGSLSDGCADLLDCGACPQGQGCGTGGSAPNTCGCLPKTCQQLGKNCGSVSDGCSGTLSCGACGPTETCGGGGTPNVCAPGTCAPKTCAGEGKNCGTISDGCGMMVPCGTCSGFATCGGSGTANVCGATCAVTCPSGFSCNAMGICAGGSIMSIGLDVKSFTVGGAVTLNAANPVSSTTSCVVSSGGSTNYPRGSVSFYDSANGYSFTFALQGCTSSAATFSGTVFPGTYRVTVQGNYSNLPGDDFVVNTALVVNAAVSNLAFDVQSLTVGGAVTLNGANPVSSTTSCVVSSGGSTNYPRGSITFDDNTKGYSFSFPLQGCTSSAATFSGTVFPGTYRVTVRGNYSNLPGDDFVVATAHIVSATVSNLAFDVRSFTVGGAVTLNGANPVSSTTSCVVSSGGSTNYPRGSVSFYDSANGYSFTFALQGCTSSAATFSGTVFPGTYRVTVQGNYSNLPGDDFVVNTALVVGAAVANLAFDVQSLTVGGAVTLNGANPVSSTTSCVVSSGGSTNYPRGSITFDDNTKGYSFSFPLQGCTSSAATFSGTVFPGTYRVTVRGNYSDLPGDDFVVATAHVVSATVSNLAFDVRSFIVGGAVTLNGANPVSSTTSCVVSSGGSTNYPRGSVSFYDSANGYSFTFALQGCTSSAATFSGTVFPGTYRVTVQGNYSNLPGDDFVVNTALVVGAAVSNLAFNVQSFTVGGAVTLNGANPVSSTTSCVVSSGGSTNYPRGSVSFDDSPNGYSFSFALQGCTSSAATFSGTVFPGTYRVTVRGNYSNLPGDDFVVIDRLAVP